MWHISFAWLCTRPPSARPPDRNKSEIDVNKQNLLFNICRFTLGELKTTFGRRPQVLRQIEDDFKFFRQTEDDLEYLGKVNKNLFWGQLETNSIF